MNLSHFTRSTGIAAAAALLAAGCTAGPDFGDPAGPLRLVAFDSCAEATEDLRAATREHVGPYGLGGMDGVEFVQGDMAVEDSAAGAAPAQAEARSSTPEHSGTNVHEAGVDEPDLVKTDGRRIISVQGNTLRVVEADRATVTGELVLTPGVDVWSPADLLLHGDQALVLIRENWWAWSGNLPSGLLDSPPFPEPTGPVGPRLLLVDLAGEPRVIGEYEVDGSFVDARQVGSVARVVIRSGPRIGFAELPEGASEAERTAANQAAVDRAELADWLPRYRVTGDGGTETGHVDCTAVSRPAEYTGTSMLTVLTFDLAAGGLGDGEPVSVVADGDTVYSNGESLYVATDRRWLSPTFRGPGAGSTEIYKFDTSGAGRPRHVASGSVPGWLINQYAMSEWDGRLRVATTTGDMWSDGADQSESAVYVLATEGADLVEVGAVGGLGKGERIYSVRFAGALGYVVTFRETDPLYTLDLSDPTAPTVLGELKITGYSAYLHPVDDRRLLGIGQEADLQGRTLGTQVSLFDVADLTAPALTAAHHVAAGHSEAEFDPHAFLWWEPEQLLVVPLTVYDFRTEGSDPPETGVLVLELRGDEFVDRGMITHPAGGDDWDMSHQIRRSLVIDDTLWTVSERGLLATSLPDLATTAWLPF